MDIAQVAELGGSLIIAAALLRAAASVFSYAGRSMRGARLDKQYIEQFRSFSAAALNKFETERKRREPSWHGKRKFRIAKRAYENQSRDICSFYLVPYDGKPLPPFQPGQFLTFELPIAGQPRPVVRCYSLSSSPAERRYYRVSVKRLQGSARTSPGLSSNYFHDRLREGDIVDVWAPAGEFCLDQDSEQPIVLIAGGVGLTPLVSMLNWLVATKSRREIWFFYGVRNRAAHAMYNHLQAIHRQNPNVRMVTVYSRPSPSCRKGVDYDIEGRLSAGLIWRVLEARRCDIYMCGPGPMMEAMTRDILARGVPRQDIRREAFASAPTRRSAGTNGAAVQKNGKTFRVKFFRSGKTVEWSTGDGTLLELAEASGVKARCGCRQGICGTCVTALRQGQVGYLRQPEKEPAAGACLPCIAQPRSDLVLDI